jgi:WD40 repeat protein
MAGAAAEVMMWLSMDSLTELHKYFEEHGDELSLEEFVTAMLKLCKDHAMGHNEQSMTALLVDLFAQVDVNGDGSLEWEEFSGFVVESGMALSYRKKPSLTVAYEEAPALSVNCRRANVRQIIALRPPPPDLTVGGVVEVADDGDVVAAPSALVEDGYIALVHDEDDTVCIMKVLPEGGVTEEPAVTLQAESDVICIQHLSDINIIVGSCANMTLAFWDLDDKVANGVDLLEPFMVKRVREPQFACVWDPSCATLFTSSGKSISAWEVRRFQAGQQSEPRITTVTDRHRLKHPDGRSAHRDLIQEMLVIPGHALLASTGMDSVINLWSSQTLTFRKERLGHKNGVRTLAWSDDGEGHGLLLSAGFDLDILVWDILSSATAPVFRLRGHLSPVLGIQTEANRAYALDSDGNFKMWDLRQGTSVLESERCLQTFTARDHRYKFHPTSSLALLPPSGAAIANSEGTVSRLPDVIAGDARIRFWRTIAVTRQGGALTPSGAIYNSTFMWIMTFSGGDVYNFSSVSGHVSEHFSGVSGEVRNNEIMSMCLDGRQRKMICGTSNGSITVHNCLNGAVMKAARSHTEPTAHSGEISVLLYCEATDDSEQPGLIFSASWDGYIKLWDDREANTVRQLRSIRHAHGTQRRMHMVPGTDYYQTEVRRARALALGCMHPSSPVPVHARRSLRIVRPLPPRSIRST